MLSKAKQTAWVLCVCVCVRKESEGVKTSLLNLSHIYRVILVLNLHFFPIYLSNLQFTHLHASLPFSQRALIYKATQSLLGKGVCMCV